MKPITSDPTLPQTRKEPVVGLFNRTRQPKGYQPTDAEIAEAAKKLNAGSHHDAWDLTLHSGDYSQQTAMRILGACVDDMGEEEVR